VEEEMKIKKILLIALVVLGSIVILFGIVVFLSRPDYGTMKEPFHPFRSQEAKDRFLSYYDSRAKSWPVASDSVMVETSYGKTFVRITGPQNMQPLVLLHGDTENSLSWIPQIESLAKNYRIFAVDHIFDNGRSVYSRPLKNSNDFINWLNELFDQLDLKNNINLLGFSYGGWQASMYALSYPNRLNKVVLIAPASTVLSPRMGYLIRAMVPYFIPNRFFIYQQVKWERSGLLEKGEAGRVIIDQMVEELVLAKQCFKQRGFVPPTVLKDGDWEKMKVPVLFLVGENEVLYSPQEAVKRLKKVAPGVKTVIIPDSSHDITHSQADLVNKQILHFFEGE
jgi:pimeloyl-ACP methyl ester carboxylesterase